MKATFADAAKLVVTADLDRPGTSAELAARAGDAFARVSQHLSRLLGQRGVDSLLRRSAILASADHAWLAGAAATPESRWSPAVLGEAMAQQPSEHVITAFVAILSTFVALLERLIGEGLVEHLLQELWPDVFPPAAKEPT